MDEIEKKKDPKKILRLPGQTYCSCHKIEITWSKWNWKKTIKSIFQNEQRWRMNNEKKLQKKFMSTSVTFQACDPSTKQEKSHLEKLWISTPDKSNIEWWNWKSLQLYCCYPMFYLIF